MSRFSSMHAYKTVNNCHQYQCELPTLYQELHHLQILINTYLLPVNEPILQVNSRRLNISQIKLHLYTFWFLVFQ